MKKHYSLSGAVVGAAALVTSAAHAASTTYKMDDAVSAVQTVLNKYNISDQSVIGDMYKSIPTEGTVSDDIYNVSVLRAVVDAVAKISGANASDVQTAADTVFKTIAFNGTTSSGLFIAKVDSAATQDKASATSSTVAAAGDSYTTSIPDAISGHKRADYGCFSTKGNYEYLCFVTGAIAIPFRSELSGKHDTYPGISGDLFFGANFHISQSFDLTPFGYIGYLPTLASTTATSSNGSSSQSSGTGSNGTTSGALDFGVGLAVPIEGATTGTTKPHIGFVFGSDTTGSTKYAYGGKPYFSVVFGMNF